MFGAGVRRNSRELGVAFRKSVLADADVVFEAGTMRYSVERGKNGFQPHEDYLR